MTPVNPIPEGEQVRRRILDAAEARFRVFGYRKTTMAEIAEDVDMSAANLYRYFEDKQDIAAACAGRCMGGRAELLREVVKRPGLAAGRAARILRADDAPVHPRSRPQPEEDQ